MLSLENQTRKYDIIKCQVEGFTGLRHIRGIEEFKKSLRYKRKIKLCTEGTRKIHLCVHFSSISVPLCSFSSKSCAKLRVVEVTFQDHKAHSRKLIPHLRPPKDSRPSLLRTSREHTMEWNNVAHNGITLLS